MKRVITASGIGVLAAVIGATAAYAQAQAPEGVTVTGSRVVTEQVGRSTIGAPINQVTLTYKVSYADLDLKTADGTKKLDERVKAAAAAACKELDRTFPLSTPDNGTCAKTAVSNAMPKVKEVIAAAGAKPTAG